MIGSNEADDVGISCDFGVADNTLCWSWHQNVVGDIQEGIEDFRDRFDQNEQFS